MGKQLLAVAVAVSFIGFGMATADAKYLKDKAPKVKGEAYVEGEAGAGSVSGKVSWSGDEPVAKIFTITKNPDVCGAVSAGAQQESKEGKRYFRFIQVEDGGLNHAVVFLEGVASGKAWGDLGATMPIRGEACAFLEYQNIVRDGTTEFTATNLDPVLHNPHTFYFKGKSRKTFFNVGINPKGETGDIVGFKFDGKLAMKKMRVFKLECDQHDFMHSWGWSASNPYAVIVGADGSYTLEGVPDGDYKLYAWHPNVGFQVEDITVAGAVTQDFTFCVKAKMKKGCA